MDDIVETEILHSKVSAEDEQEETNKELIDLIEDVDRESDDIEEDDCVYKGKLLKLISFKLVHKKITNHF